MRMSIVACTAKISGDTNEGSIDQVATDLVSIHHANEMTAIAQGKYWAISFGKLFKRPVWARWPCDSSAKTADQYGLLLGFRW